ncbi:MAG: tetratricopeptide repeat protein [Phycisphaerae bacterium]
MRGRSWFTAAWISAILACPMAWASTSTEKPEKDASDAAELQAYLSGNGLLGRGLYELAATEYRTFLVAHPKHEKAPVARYGLAVSLFRLGKLEEAADELRRLESLKHFTYAAEVATLLGQCRLAAGQYDEAAESFRSVLRNHPDHALADDAAAQLIEALYRMGRTKQALAECEAFEAKHADLRLLERIDYFGGLAEMRQSAYKAAARRFARLLKQHPDSAFADHATLLLAQCHHNTGALARAHREYRRVLKRPDSGYRADALLGLATLLRQQHKPKESAETADRLLEEFPQSPLAGAAEMLRGQATFDAADYKAAMKRFAKAAQSDKTIAGEAAYWSAKCKLRLNDFEGASDALTKAIQTYPDCRLMPEMCYDLAIAELRGGHPKRAGERLARFRVDYPDHALAPEALELLAEIAHQQGDYEKSQQYAQEYDKSRMDRKPSSRIAFLTAENDYLMNRLESAAKAYRRFLQAYGDDAQAETARYRLGMTLYRLGKLDEAREWLAAVKGEGTMADRFRALHLALGDISFQRGKWARAEHHLRAYLEAGLYVSAADDAVLKLGLALERQEHFTDALEQFDRLLTRFEKSPHRLQALFERGQALVALERMDEAAKALEAVLAHEGTSRFDTPALQHLAAIAVRRGDYEKAADYFSRVARASKGSEAEAEALFEEGRAWMNAKAFKRAEAALARLADRFPKHKRAAEADANRAIALSRQDRCADALALMDRIDVSRLEPEMQASMRYERAWCLRAAGRETEAEKAYRTLASGKIGDRLRAHALLELADIRSKASHKQEAVGLLRELSDLIERGGGALPDRLKAQAAYRLGTLLFELKKHEEAVRTLDGFIRRFPKSELIRSASFFCGEALFESGRHEQAVAHFQRVVAGPKSDTAYGPSLLRLGECQAALQHWSESERAFAEYLKRFGSGPRWFQAEFGVGWARENQGRFEEAARSYQRVVARHKGETAARAQFQIGQCLFAQKRYEDAARELLKVDILYGYPKWSAAALYEAGRCFEKLSKTAEATQQFKAVATKYKNTHWAKLASGRLAAPAKPDLPGR